MANEKDPKKDLKQYARIAHEKGLVWGKSGNISVRLDDERFLISASSASLSDLSDDDIVYCNISKDTWRGSKKPSIEVKMHKAVYQARVGINAILHSQPFFTTLIACSDISIHTALFPEAIAYLGRIERVAYHHPGSDKLAKAAALKAKDSDVLVLDNHGAVCTAESLEEVILKTETLEFLSRLLIYAKIGDVSLSVLSDEVVEDFIQHLEKIGRV